jgi:hypothetical protein
LGNRKKQNGKGERKMEIKMSEVELVQAGYKCHHYAAEKGYTRVGDIGTCVRYAGRFGEGYKRYAGAWRGSSKYTTVEYWTK